MKFSDRNVFERHFNTSIVSCDPIGGKLSLQGSNFRLVLMAGEYAAT